jgi:hypothetical protein
MHAPDPVTDLDDLLRDGLRELRVDPNRVMIVAKMFGIDLDSLTETNLRAVASLILTWVELLHEAGRP